MAARRRVAMAARASTRPCACEARHAFRPVDSADVASMMVRASSSGIVSRIGRILVVMVLPRAPSPVQLLHDVPELREDQPGHRQPDRVLGPGEDEDRLASDRTCAARLSIAAAWISSKLSIRNSSPKAVQSLLEQPIDRLECPVTRGDAGAPSGDDYAGGGVGKLSAVRRR